MGTMGLSADTLLDGLDDAQRSAATALQGPVRIIAGAGAGKTRTVTRRIAYGCATRQWDPSRTLAVTFSVKAAAEMHSRLNTLEVASSVQASTFHSAALRQLRDVWPDICETPLPHVAREPREIVGRAIRRVLSSDQFGDMEIRAIQAEINWTKISLIAPADYVRVCSSMHRQPPAGLEPDRFADVINAYEQEKTSRGEIDFDDILLLACHILDDFEDAATSIRSNIGWLTVDEYQDVSPLQHRLLTLWLNGNTNVCVVGDPAQTIYSFAGASSYDLLGFADEFAPLAADINLNVDYRSTPQVIHCANAVLHAAPNREDYLRLEPRRESGMKVSKIVYDDDEQEAQGVASRIVRLINAGAMASQCAVLTRINAQQRIVCKALRDAGLRYRIRRDAGWSSSALDDDSQVRQAMLETLGLGADVAGVTISTIHAAKGLEFKHVFIIGCSEGLLPYSAPAPGDALEEERRLMYVGVTRAEDSLHLSYARHQEAGSGMMRTPSRFL
jgi:DNA helicase-2/ATP-dependent DNA helicase PcrA